jgi:hypothetical protein
MYKIDKNIPVAKYAHNPYPFNQMDVGDSFAVPANGAALYIVQRRLTSSIAAYRKRGHGNERYTTARNVAENVVRVWRVE